MPGEVYNSDFTRKVDKSQIPVCNIMGVNIAAINMPWLLDFTGKHVKELSGDYMTVANVHTTVTAYDDSDYCKVQNGGIMAIPDGGPLSKLGRKRGFTEMERTTGPTYMAEALKHFASHGYTHYFYGSTQETLDKLSEKIHEIDPEIKISGMYSPPFRDLTDEEDKEIINKINEASPDFIWVGLGAPKQEKWMANHQGKLSGFMVGVGAGFDYLAGTLKRAPKWMQDNNIEWVYRLIQEPKRLFFRYLYTNTKFIFNAYLRNK